MKKITNVKALSPVVASIIIIAVTVTVAIAVAAWMGALSFDFGLNKKLVCDRIETSVLANARVNVNSSVMISYHLVKKGVISDFDFLINRTAYPVVSDWCNATFMYDTAGSRTFVSSVFPKNFVDFNYTQEPPNPTIIWDEVTIRYSAYVDENITIPEPLDYCGCSMLYGKAEISLGPKEYSITFWSGIVPLNSTFTVRGYLIGSPELTMIVNYYYKVAENEYSFLFTRTYIVVVHPFLKEVP